MNKATPFVFNVSDDGAYLSKRIIVGASTAMDDPFALAVASGEIFINRDDFGVIRQPTSQTPLASVIR